MKALRGMRPRLRATTAVVVLAAFNSLLYHWPLQAYASARLDLTGAGGVATLAAVHALVAFVTAIALCAVCLLSSRLLKPVGMVLAVANAGALYFMHAYGVVLDRAMMGNVANTDWAEATAFLSPAMLLFVLMLGFVPAAVLSRVEIVPDHRGRLVLQGVVLVVLGTGAMYLASASWLWIDRHARVIGGMILPWSYVVNAGRHVSTQLAATRAATALPDASFGSDEKTVVLLVIGESARAASFSLYGYGRATNPKLAAAGAVPLRNARACATYTTAALMCILSHDDPGSLLAGAKELLPGYLQRHGIDVAWRTNNWGEPALRLADHRRAKDLASGCAGEGCAHDEVLLHGLEARIRASAGRKLLVVMHQTGSHGPSYASKHPPSFELFRPACKSVELSQCPPGSLVNAYDNTILYTDHVLARAIEVLKGLGDVSSTLLYVSDHGESLGEYGLYLHGTPLAVAPEVQTAIPFVVWMSDAFKRRHRADDAVLLARQAHSHANVFHSVMGAFDMRSSVYVRDLDIFASHSASTRQPQPGR